MAVIEKDIIEKVLKETPKQRKMRKRKQEVSEKLLEEFESLLEMTSYERDEKISGFKDMVLTYDKIEKQIDSAYQIQSTAQKIQVATKRVKKKVETKDESFTDILLKAGGNNG